MKITFVNKYYFPPHLGGVEQSLNLLAGALAARDGMDVCAVVANEAPRKTTELIDGVRVERLARIAAPASTPLAAGMPGAIRREMRSGGLMHLQFPYPWGDMSWLLAGAPGPCVMTYHADVVKQKRIMAAYAPILRSVLQRVDRVIVGAPQLIEHSPFLAPIAQKCRVVPFAIDLDRFAGVDEARVAEIRARVGGPFVLFVGRLVYYKGVDVLIRAMRDVGSRLVIIGTGPLEAELRALAVASGVGQQVTFMEPVPDAELAAWYRAADVFCLPSTARTEAYGLVQLEAHQAGTPVVSTDLPSGVPFVNEDGETGYIVKPGDAGQLALALRTLLDDDRLRDEMGKKASRRVRERFSIDAMVRGTLDVYSEALETRG